MLPPYSPELDPSEAREVVSGVQAQALKQDVFETVALLQEALTQTLVPYWEEPALLKRLTAYSWWVEAVAAL
jgi:hypothetical protein